VRTGVRVQIPEGYVGLLCIRSSLAKQGAYLLNGIGVIDSDYRGEVRMLMGCTGSVVITKHDRIGQLVVVPCFTGPAQPVTELDKTERGEGGFGSTGRQ